MLVTCKLSLFAERKEEEKINNENEPTRKRRKRRRKRRRRRVKVGKVDTKTNALWTVTVKFITLQEL